MAWLYVNVDVPNSWLGRNGPVLIGKVETPDLSASIDELKSLLPKNRRIRVHPFEGDFSREVTIF